MESRTCTKCGETKPLDAYYFEKGNPRASCKECHKASIYAKREADPDAAREYLREWREKNPGKHAEYERQRRARDGEKINERRREQRAENPDAVRASQRATRAKRPEHYRAQQREWYNANREKMNESRRNQRLADPERFRVEERIWRDQNREHISERNRQYYAENSEQWDHYRAKREAGKRGVPHVPYTRRQIFDRDDGICQHCARTLTYGIGEAEIDHIVPVELGGWDLPGNLQLLCRECNRRKWARLVFTNPARRSVTS